MLEVLIALAIGLATDWSWAFAVFLILRVGEWLL